MYTYLCYSPHIFMIHLSPIILITYIFLLRNVLYTFMPPLYVLCIIIDPYRSHSFQLLKSSTKLIYTKVNGFNAFLSYYTDYVYCVTTNHTICIRNLHKEIDIHLMFLNDLM
jgi:hypothetical protein